MTETGGDTTRFPFCQLLGAYTTPRHRPLPPTGRIREALYPQESNVLCQLGAIAIEFGEQNIAYNTSASAKRYRTATLAVCH